MNGPFKRWPPRAASLLLCLLFWQLAASHHWNLGLVTFANVPTPVAVIQAALGLGDSGKKRPVVCGSEIF